MCCGLSAITCMACSWNFMYSNRHPGSPIGLWAVGICLPIPQLNAAFGRLRLVPHPRCRNCIQALHGHALQGGLPCNGATNAKRQHMHWMCFGMEHCSYCPLNAAIHKVLMALRLTQRAGNVSQGRAINKGKLKGWCKPFASAPTNPHHPSPINQRAGANGEAKAWSWPKNRTTSACAVASNLAGWTTSPEC